MALQLIANYHEPRGTLRALAAPNCDVRALFLEGGAHFGKSFLLEGLKSELSIKVALVALDKRRGAPGPLQLMAEIAALLGREHFPKFAMSVLANQRPIHADMKNVSIIGSYNNVQSIAQESEDDRLLTATLVTADFLDDLRAFPEELRPVILAFDGYDASSSLIDRWFDEVLVGKLCCMDHLRLIICGREVPANVKQRSAVGRCVELPLTGVADEQEWVNFIAALNWRIPEVDDARRAARLRGIVGAFNGAPGLILAHLKSLQVA